MRDHWHAAEDHDAVVVLQNLVAFDPDVARLDDEDAFASTALNFVVHNKRIDTVEAADGYLRLNILENVVLFNAGLWRLDQQDPLREILANLVLENDDVGFLFTADARFQIVHNRVAFNS